MKIGISEKDKSILELIRENKIKVKFTPMMAAVNGKIASLNAKVNSGDCVEVFDVRSNVGIASYQEGLVLVYLTAVKNLFGNVLVGINNSLNKGFYTKPDKSIELNEENIERIRMEMDKLIRADFPFKEKRARKDEYIDLLSMYGSGNKAKEKFLENIRMDDSKIAYIKQFRDDEEASDRNCYMLSYMDLPPSTRYVDKFQLMRYKGGLLLRFPYQANPDEIPRLDDEKRIYEAFVENTRWQKIMGIVGVSDLNEKIESGGISEVIQISETFQEKKLVEITKEVRAKKKKIVLIAGPSSSGKTTFAKRLMIHLKTEELDSVYIGTDDYFIDRDDMVVDEKGEKNFEDLEAIDLQLFNDQLKKMIAGKEVDIPRFDFITGKKVFGERVMKVRENQIMVIEGIHGLNPDLIWEVDEKDIFKIYISPIASLSLDLHHRIATSDIRLIRRMVRDFNTRGKSCYDTLSTWYKVRKGEDKNIFPYSNCCDAFFNTFLIYEIPLLKKSAMKILDGIDKESVYAAERERILSMLEKFDDGNYLEEVPRDSIVREFVGGSVFE